MCVYYISYGLIIMNLWRYCAVGTSCGGALLPSSSFAPKGIARGSDKKVKHRNWNELIGGIVSTPIH